MRVTTETNTFSGNIPDSIIANVFLEGEVIIEATRAWDDPQWYLYDVAFRGSRWGDVDHTSEEGVGNIEDKYPIPADSEVGRALERAAEKVRGEYVPA